MSNVAHTSNGVNTDYENVIRFPKWLCLAISSAVCLVAVATQSDDLRWADRITISLAVVSTCVSLAVTMAYLFAPDLMTKSTLAEGIMVHIMLVLK